MDVTRTQPPSGPTTAAAKAEPGAIWSSPDQREIDALALSLLGHPAVRAARDRTVQRFEASPEFAVPDAPAWMAATVDDLLFSCLQFAAIDDPSRPKVMWTLRRPYSYGGREFPGSHYGADNPDRVYRMIGVDARYSYRIIGRRHPTHPSEDDLGFEAIPPPGLWGQPLVRLPRERIDIAADGSFEIVADGTEADGRRNHLYLPPESKVVVVRDTLLDWAAQVPNEVSVELLGGPAAPLRTNDEIARAGAEIYERCVTLALGFMDNCLRTGQPNELLAFERPVKWGVAGGLFAVNRFELAEGEALLITLDPLTAGYLAINACDPWTRALPYDTALASLNNVQAQADTDGAYTFVLSPRDPGVHNWIDTAGLRTGAVVARWELMTQRPPTVDSGKDDSKAWALGRTVVDAAVRQSRVLPVSEVPAAIPEGQALVGRRERQAQIAARAAEHHVRVTGVPISPEP